MSEPRRLLESGSPLERVLVSSWKGEQPSSAARLAALSVGGAAVGLEGAKLASAGAKTAAAGVKNAAAAIVAKPVLPAATLLKITVASVVALALAGGAIVALTSTKGPAGVATQGRPRPASNAPADRIGTPPRETVTPDSLPVASGSLALTPGELPDAPLVSPRPGTSTRRVASNDARETAPRSDEPRGSDVAREIAKVDVARKALAGGQPRSALSELTAYEEAFPNGVLAEEASALRAEALVRAGERDAAQSAAERFHARWPTSPHAARLRALGLTIP